MNIQTIRRKKHLIILVALLFLLLVNILISLKSFAASTRNVTVTSDVYFCLPNGSEINFANGQGFNTITPENSTGEWYWAFDSYKFQVQNANMTITNYFSTRILAGGNVQTTLAFDLTGPNGTSTTKIITDKGEPDSVTGASNWAYNMTTNILTLNVTHASPQEVEVIWGSFSAFMAMVEANVFLVFILVALIPIILTSLALIAGDPKLIVLSISITVIVIAGFVALMLLTGLINI